MNDKTKTVPFMDVYNNMIDKSNFNTDEGEYVKGSSIINKVPILRNNHNKENGGTLTVQLFTMSSQPDEVSLVISVNDKEGSLQDGVNIKLSHESCREIGNIISATVFDSRFRLAN